MTKETKENNSKITENKESLKEKVSKAAEKVKKAIKKSPEEKIKELEEQLKEVNDEKLRTLAEFQNFRKRKEQEMLETRDRTIINFVIELLPSIDNFEMALKMTDNQQMFVKGVEMIHKNLIDTLKEHKIEEFEPGIGDEFEPSKHDPILIETEDAEPGRVLAVVKKGYQHKENIIRPARVNVKKEVESEE